MEILITIILLLFFACILGSIIINFYQIRNSTETAMAVIKDIFVRTEYVNGGKQEFFYPVFEYYAEGEKFEKRSEQYSSVSDVEIGQKVIVKYPPNYPQDAYLEIYEERKFKNNKVAFWVVLSLAIVFLLSITPLVVLEINKIIK